MRNTSKKRAKQLKEYFFYKKDYARKNRYNIKCFLCGQKIKIPVETPDPEQYFDFHHIYGEKENDHLINILEIEPVHRECHNDYHNNPAKKITWFGRYLMRIKFTHPSLYEKEKSKI